MKRLTLRDLGYASDAFGAAWPVRLFDAATFATLRAAASAPTQAAVMRGLAARDPAVDAAWRAVDLSPLVGARVRVHPLLAERAHVNCQLPGASVVFDWHVDSQPLVAVLALTAGGETRLAHGDASEEEETHVVLRPGEALVLRGDVVRHCATARPGEGRRTMVTPFVFADLARPDRTDLRLARTYGGGGEKEVRAFLEYRLARASKRLSAGVASEEVLEELAGALDRSRPPDTRAEPCERLEGWTDVCHP